MSLLRRCRLPLVRTFLLLAGIFIIGHSYIKDGQIFEGKYSPFSGNLYGTAPQGKQGMVSFSLDNNLEMKIKSDRDTTGERRISLIEKLSLSNFVQYGGRLPEME